MAEPDYSYKEILEAWLREQTREVSVVIAARTALRVLPNILFDFGLSDRKADTIISALALSTFRALSVTWVAAKYPTRVTELTRSARSASSASSAARSARSADSALSAAHSARSALSADSAARSASSALSAARSALSARSADSALNDDVAFLKNEKAAAMAKRQAR